MQQSFLKTSSIIFILLFLSCCTSSNKGNPENGSRWYGLHNCAACHGQNGSGGKGPQLAGLDLSRRAFMAKLRKPESAIMPSFGKEKISASDGADIYVWLKTVFDK